MNNMSNDISSSLLNKKSESDDDINLNIVIEMDNLIHNNESNSTEIKNNNTNEIKNNNSTEIVYNNINNKDDDIIEEGHIIEIDQKICRICLVEYNSEELISPCKCSGTSKYIHKECLQMWFDKSTNEIAKKECMECKYQYKYIGDDSESTTNIPWYKRLCCDYEQNLNVYLKTSYVMLYFLNFLCGYFIYLMDTQQVLYNLEKDNTEYLMYVVYGFYGCVFLLVSILLYGLICCFICKQYLDYRRILLQMKCNGCMFTCSILIIAGIMYNEILGLIILIPILQSKIIYLYNNEYVRTTREASNTRQYNVDNIVEVRD